MKMSSPERRRFEGCSIAQHCPKDIDPPPGESDEGLDVPLALTSLAVIEGSGLGRTSEACEGGLVEDPLGNLVATPHPSVVASPFTGVVGGGHKTCVSGELVGALESTEVPGGDQKLGSEGY